MYFYLKWINKRPDEIIITTDKPEKVNFCNYFNIKKDRHCICGEINESFDNYNFSNDLLYTKKYYLSSHIQKSVRQMDKIKSIKSSKHLIDLDINSFLRRLPIIMLEDVTIHESFPIIVWLMIANTKQFKIKNVMVQWLLGITYMLSECSEKTEYGKKIDNQIWEIKDNYINTILYGLQFRKEYGGMKGDMGMIEYYKQSIIDNKLIINKSKIPFIKLFISPLPYNQWILSANDFHCNKFMINNIHEKHQNLSKEKIKQLIWIFKSSYNKRVHINLLEHDNIKEWNIIKLSVENYQKNCKYY